MQLLINLHFVGLRLLITELLISHIFGNNGFGETSSTLGVTTDGLRLYGINQCKLTHPEFRDVINIKIFAFLESLLQILVDQYHLSPMVIICFGDIVENRLI